MYYLTLNLTFVFPGQQMTSFKLFLKPQNKLGIYYSIYNIIKNIFRGRLELEARDIFSIRPLGKSGYQNMGACCGTSRFFIFNPKGLSV